MVLITRKDIVMQHIEKNSSNKFASYVSITLLTYVTLSSKLYKHQQIEIASQVKGDLIISHQALLMIVFADSAFEHVLLVSSCLFTSQVSYYYYTPFLAIHWLSLLCCRIMNEVLTFCSKLEWELSLLKEGIIKV